MKTLTETDKKNIALAEYDGRLFSPWRENQKWGVSFKTYEECRAYIANNLDESVELITPQLGWNQGVGRYHDKQAWLWGVVERLLTEMYVDGEAVSIRTLRRNKQTMQMMVRFDRMGLHQADTLQEAMFEAAYELVEALKQVERPAKRPSVFAETKDAMLLIDYEENGVLAIDNAEFNLSVGDVIIQIGDYAGGMAFHNRVDNFKTGVTYAGQLLKPLEQPVFFNGVPMAEVLCFEVNEPKAAVKGAKNYLLYAVFRKDNHVELMISGNPLRVYRPLFFKA